MQSVSPEDHRDIASVLYSAEIAARNDNPVREASILCAASLLTLATEQDQARYWDCFRRLSEKYLVRLGSGGEAQAPLIDFLRTTDYGEVVHFRRNDPHLWNVRLHVVRADGQWLACDGRYDGVFFCVGGAHGKPQATGGRVGEACSETQTVSEIVGSISGGFHAKALGRTPVVRVLLNNARPLDQSATISQIAQMLRSIKPHFGVRIYQHKTTAFFDPALFPAIKSQGPVIFYMRREADPRVEALSAGESIAESFYLPEQSWEASHRTSLFLKENIINYIGERPLNRSRNVVKLFVSLEFEKRVWLEQAEALLHLFKSIGSDGTKLIIAVNGMTGTIFEPLTNEMMRHFSAVVEREKEVIARWQEALGPRAEIIHLSGSDLVSKVAAIRGYDFFAAPGGTAAFIAFLANIPGVFYSHPGLRDHFCNQLSMFASAIPVCGDATKADSSVPGEFKYDWAGVGGESYSIPADAFVVEAMRHYHHVSAQAGNT